MIVNSAPCISSGVKSCVPEVGISSQIESMSRLATGEGMVFKGFLILLFCFGKVLTMMGSWEFKRRMYEG